MLPIDLGLDARDQGMVRVDFENRLALPDVLPRGLEHPTHMTAQVALFRDQTRRRLRQTRAHPHVLDALSEYAFNALRQGRKLLRHFLALRAFLTIRLG